MDHFDNLFVPSCVSLGNIRFEAWELRHFEKRVEQFILFLPGWALTPRAYRDFLRMLWEAGYSIFTLSFPTEDLTKETAPSIPKLPDPERTRVAALIHLLERENDKSFVAIMHSQGALSALTLMEHIPTQFSGGILIAPGGFEKISLPRILVRFGMSKPLSLLGIVSMSPRERERFKESLTDGKNWLKKRGYWKALWEGRKPGQVDLLPLTSELQKKGVSLHVMLAAADRMVPFTLGERFQRAGVPVTAVPGDHNGLVVQPERYKIPILKILNDPCFLRSPFREASL